MHNNVAHFQYKINLTSQKLTTLSFTKLVFTWSSAWTSGEVLFWLQISFSLYFRWASVRISDLLQSGLLINFSLVRQHWRALVLESIRERCLWFSSPTLPSISCYYLDGCELCGCTAAVLWDAVSRISSKPHAVFLRNFHVFRNSSGGASKQ